MLAHTKILTHGHTLEHAKMVLITELSWSLEVCGFVIFYKYTEPFEMSWTLTTQSTAPPAGHTHKCSHHGGLSAHPVHFRHATSNFSGFTDYQRLTSVHVKTHKCWFSALHWGCSRPYQMCRNSFRGPKCKYDGSLWPTDTSRLMVSMVTLCQVCSEVSFSSCLFWWLFASSLVSSSDTCDQPDSSHTIVRIIPLIGLKCPLVSWCVCLELLSCCIAL